ncbi:MAG TPA: hypothetical protein VHD85_13945, partial [Terracidiphilus sp.]|nr:hypothetical protein [Terracidiphilus sp.]
PGKLWAANVYYMSPVNMNVSFAKAGKFIKNLPADSAARNEIEEELYESLAYRIKHTENTLTQINANNVSFSTVDGEALTQEENDLIVQGKAAMYFIDIVSNRYGHPIAALCIYRTSESQAVTLCHDHNFP